MKLDTSMPNLASVLEAFNEVAETSRDFVAPVGWSKNYVCYFLVFIVAVVFFPIGSMYSV